MLNRIIQLLMLIIAFNFLIPQIYAQSILNFPSNNIENEISIFRNQSPDINSNVLRLALKAYHRAREMGLDNKHLLTVIDYTIVSSRSRLWVLDMEHKAIIFKTLVAHGRNSGYDRVTQVSDRVGSLESTNGVFLTGNTYCGHNGVSMILRGLEKGINDKAQARRIVMHGAWYVSEAFIHRYGRLGLSWGCPAVSQEVARPLINAIKGGTILFAYYPSYNWLSHSRFI